MQRRPLLFVTIRQRLIVFFIAVTFVSEVTKRTLLSLNISTGDLIPVHPDELHPDELHPDELHPTQMSMPTACRSSDQVPATLTPPTTVISVEPEIFFRLIGCCEARAVKSDLFLL